MRYIKSSGKIYMVFFYICLIIIVWILVVIHTIIDEGVLYEQVN